MHFDLYISELHKFGQKLFVPLRDSEIAIQGSKWHGQGHPWGSWYSLTYSAIFFRLSVLAYSRDAKNSNERQIRVTESYKSYNDLKKGKAIVPVDPWYHDTALQSFSLQIMHL